MDAIDHEMAKFEANASSGSPQRRGSEAKSLASAESVTSTASSGYDRSRRPSDLDRVRTHEDIDQNSEVLRRIATERTQQRATVGRSGKCHESKKQLPAFGAGKPYPPPLPDREEYVVEFDGPNDPLHAQNWPLWKKLLDSGLLGYTTMCAAFASSIFSTATRPVGREFGVSQEVGLLGIAFFVLGFAFGPTLWAPLSEIKGRRLPIVLSMFGFAVFSLATATAKDLQTVLIARFFAGFFGASPLAVVGACFSDMYDNRTRGIAITVFAVIVFTGPLLAPFIGGFIVESSLGWRWTEYLVAIMGFIAFVLDLILLKETYPPAILVEKATELRRRTLNWGIHAKQEEVEIDYRELITKNFSRPLRLLFGEPIVLLLSLYMSFIYGLLYLFLTAYPLVFQGVYGFSAGVGGLAFLGMVVGELLAGIVVLIQQPWYQRKLAANNGVPIPEWRLPSVIAGGVAFAIGIFWFGWAGYRREVHWIVPALSGLFTGFGLLSIFLQSLNYLVDAYLIFAASAIAGNTFLRSLFGAAFPLFSIQMFDTLGIQWAATLLGCIAVVMIPIPVIFYVYGHRIRKHSSFAPTPARDSEDDDASDGTAAQEMQEQSAAAASTPRKDGDDATNNV